MSAFNKKMTEHAKKQDNMIYIENDSIFLIRNKGKIKTLSDNQKQREFITKRAT